MTLPAGGKTPWPPTALHREYRAFAEHAAWYGGDSEQLARVYGGHTNIDALLGTPSRSSMDKADRGPWWRKWMFWARTTTEIPYSRRRIHVPLASDIAATSAALLFAKPVKLQIAEAHTQGASTDAKAAQTRLEQIEELGGIRALFTEAAEDSAALGGVYFRVVWDKAAVPDRPILSIVHADSAVPEFVWGNLTAVTFWRHVGPQEDKVFRHLERHERGQILHGLYEGSRDELGDRVPLNSLPDTQVLVTDDLTSGEQVVTGIDRLTAVYVPNMKPNRLIRDTEQGRSDYQSNEDLMDALDETYTSWMRDLRLARARLVVPQEYLDPLGKGKGESFDVDREIYNTLEGLDPDKEKSTITQVQFAIRTQDHSETAKNLVERIVSTAGYSYSTFGISEGTSAARPATATEVAARERRSLITRNQKTGHWTKPMADILEVLLAIDNKVFNGPVPARPTAVFPDGAPAEPQVTATTIELLARAKAISTKSMVLMQHPDWEPERVDEEVAAIERMPQPPGAPSYVPPSDPNNPDGGVPPLPDPTTGL